MVQYKNVNEFLSTAKGTEGSLLIVKKIYDKLITETEKAMIPRSEAAIYIPPSQIPGSSVDVDIETADSLTVRELGEYAENLMDEPDYSSINLKPKKYGTSIRISQEMIEDGKWNLLDRSIKLAGKRLGENENSLVIAQLDNAANTVSGNAAITVANITRGMQYLEDSDFDATSFAVGSEVVRDIRQIDSFAEADKRGSDEMQIKGFLGVIYGMRVFKVSSNAGMTATTSYLWDRDEAYAIAEKRPVTMDKFKLPLIDAQAVSVTQRLKVRYIKSSAICKITTS